eukprot:scaffold4.g4621.t1
MAGVPPLIAFAAIVFRDPVYAPYLPELCKFLFLASSIAQFVACVGSALPYVVAQDVGLIFLSMMASSIADQCAAEGLPPAVALGTSLLALTFSTLVVGLGMVAVARFKLARAVEFIPLPVVAGYLSFVGYFCIAGGVGLGVGVELSRLPAWAQLAATPGRLAKLAATGGACLVMKAVTARSSHPAALPGVLVAINAVFWAALWAGGGTMASAQAAGWVMRSPEASQRKFWELWDLFDMPGLSLARLHLPAAARQAGKLAGLFLVVTFGACMDVAAIQQDTPRKLDVDRELTTIGLSNVLSGLCGAGFTSSYIFSQSIFSARSGAVSRLSGLVIGSAELALFALPGSIVQFGIEISKDWLVLSYRKFTRMVAAFRVLPAQSSVVRAAEPGAVLAMLRPAHLATMQLRGFIFFGTASHLGRRLHAAASELAAGAAASEAAAEALYSGTSKHGSALVAAAAAPRFFLLDFTHARGLDATGARTLGVLLRDLQALGITAIVTGADHHAIRQLLRGHGAPLSPAPPPPPPPPGGLPGGSPARAALGSSTFVGVPAPASEAAAEALARQLSQRLSIDGRGAAQGGGCLEFAGLEEALRYCEGRLLQARELGIAAPHEAPGLAQALARYFSRRVHAAGDVLWRLGEEADELYYIEQARLGRCGSLGAVHVEQHYSQDSRAGGGGGGAGTEGGVVLLAAAPPPGGAATRVFEFWPGTLLGAVDFFLAQPHTSTAVCGSRACRLLVLRRCDVSRMAAEAPREMLVFQTVALRAKFADLHAALHKQTAEAGRSVAVRAEVAVEAAAPGAETVKSGPNLQARMRYFFHNDNQLLLVCVMWLVTGALKDIQEIMNILPHRYPFLLVDRVLEWEYGKYAVGYKCVTVNDNFFPGHFPQRAIMPGVLQVEAMAQLGGIVMIDPAVAAQQTNFFFGGVENCRWRKPVVPGDVLMMRVEVTKFNKRFGICKMKAEAYVGEDVVCDAELTLVMGK